MKSPKPSSKTSSRGEEPRPAKLWLSSAAEAELEASNTFSFEQFGEQVASTYTRRFADSFDRLRRHRLVGEQASDVGKGRRSLMDRGHRILYKTGEDKVLIVPVYHHAMDAKRAFKATEK